MAPEQARGDADPGPPADIFSLGLLLFELASGQQRAADPNLLRILRSRSQGRSGLPWGSMNGLSPGLRDVIRRCVEGHPADRYPSCEALERDLVDVHEGRTPGMGALSAPQRLWRRVGRHPWRAFACVAALLLIGAVSGHTWWTWPRDVRIGTQLDGKWLWIDGRMVGTTPVTVRLEPGTHDYEMKSGMDRAIGPDVYRGELSVPRGEGVHSIFLFLDPPHTVQEVPLLPSEAPHLPPQLLPGDVAQTGPLAWIQLSVMLQSANQETIQVTVDGEVFEETPNICSFRLPLGPHSIVIEADGYRTIRREIDLKTQELCMLSMEMDPLDSPWHTVLLYSVAEYDVQRWVVDQGGMKIQCEQGQDVDDKDRFSTKSYWGPQCGGEPGFVLLAVELPVSPGQLELRTVRYSVAPAGWSLIEAGASPDELVPIGLQGPEDPPLSILGDWSPEEARISGDTLRADPVGDSVGAIEAELVRRLGGSRTLYIRLTSGGVPVGDGVSFACALRCDGLPTRIPSGGAVWEPGMRIRVME
jgi:hypothetical protein